MNKEMLSILSGLSNLGEAIVAGRESRAEAQKTLEKHEKLLHAHLGGMERAEAVKAMKDAKVHEVIAKMVANILWPKPEQKTAKFKADQKAAMLKLIPQDPKEARAWIRGLAELVKQNRPFPKAEKE